MYTVLAICQMDWLMCREGGEQSVFVTVSTMHSQKARDLEIGAFDTIYYIDRVRLWALWLYIVVLRVKAHNDIQKVLVY
jgi:hypothetical protein